jgi:hypothetical protein
MRNLNRQTGRRILSFDSPPRFEELENLLLVARIAQAAHLQPFSIAESKLTTVLSGGRADAAVLEQQLRDPGSVLSHIAAADEAGQHSEIRMRNLRE